MKYIIRLAFLLTLNACNTETKTSDQKQKDTEKDSLPVEFINVTTALDVVPLRQLPKGFHLDSIMKTDTISGHQTIIYYPVAETNAAFNKKLKAFIQKREQEYIPDRKPEEYAYSSFDMWLLSVDSVQKNKSSNLKCKAFIREQLIIITIVSYLFIKTEQVSGFSLPVKQVVLYHKSNDT